MAMAAAAGAVPAGAGAAERRDLYGFWVPLALMLGFAALALYRYALLWELDAAGLSARVGKVPEWDFANLWAGARLALDGRIDALFDVAAFREAFAELARPEIEGREWSYPPTMLLVGAPFALLPLGTAYWLWHAVTVGLLALALRAAGLRGGWIAFLALSPAALGSLLLGQNGAFTAALLIGGLALVPTRPVLAGIAFGVLTVKPQLGLVVPLCLIACGAWRCFGAATLTAIGLALLAALAFGVEAWVGFLEATRPMMSAIMEAPAPQPYHVRSVNAFLLARMAGADLALGYAVQAACSAAAIAAAARLWRPDVAIEPGRRAALTAALAVLALPYGYTYDAIPIAVLAVLMLRQGWVWLALAAWASPLMFELAMQGGAGAKALAPTLALWIALVALGAWALRERRAL